MTPLRAHGRRSGFSLLELIITLSLISILVGVVGFRSSSVIEKGKVSSILQMTKHLTTACAMFQSDTGALPVEYPGSSNSTYRDLSSTQTTAGWAGPYIDKPLAHSSSNPFGRLYLYNRVNANGWLPGFDLDGDGNLDVTTSGNMLWLDGITQSAAQAIDKALDDGVPGDWATTGQFRWDSAREDGFILVYR